MAFSLNEVKIIGALGRDPEVRTMQSGDKVVNLSVATSEQWKDKASGERKERTEWHRVTIWNQNIANIAERYLKKGSMVYLTGSLETRKWQDQGGNDRFSTEVVLRGFDCKLGLMGKPPDRSNDDNGEQRQSNSPPRGSSTGNGPSGAPSWDAPRSGDLDDEIPF